jgi:hypothetical protein
VRLHDLRHNLASVAVAAGESLFVTGKVLGHRKVRSTERYAHLADDPIRAAADRAAKQIAWHLAGGMDDTGGEVRPLRADRATPSMLPATTSARSRPTAASRRSPRASGPQPRPAVPSDYSRRSS